MHSDVMKVQGPELRGRRTECDAQVKGGKEVTLTPGQTFYEGRDDVHLVGRNASSTARARFVVFLLKDTGAPAALPVP